MTRIKPNPVLDTLLYASIFNYPLSFEEVWLRLQSITHINEEHTNDLLRGLIQSKKISFFQGYYFVTGSSVDLTSLHKRKQNSILKLQTAKKIISKISWIPWLESVCVTGSVAANNTQDDDDIDLLVITSNKRLWITRFLLIITLEILHVRRRPGVKIFKDKFCLNMFMEKDSMLIEPENRNQYTAHELLQTVCIYEKNQNYHDFIKLNNWVKNYLSNWYTSKINDNGDYKYQSTAHSKPNFVITWILDGVNRLFYLSQLIYMKKKQSSETIQYCRAFFHPNSVKSRILKRFELSKKSFY